MWGVKHNKVTDSSDISRSFPYPPLSRRKGAHCSYVLDFFREYIYIYTHIDTITYLTMGTLSYLVGSLKHTRCRRFF
jgi:hypothetical protein